MIGKLIRRVLLLLLLVVVVLNWTWGRIPSEPDPPSGAKYAQVEGSKIFYEEQAGREPAVLMLHGLPGTHYDWQDVAKATGQRTIAIDRPGFGWTTGGYVAFDEQVKLLHALATKLRLKKPVIAGHSYGGTLALGYARAYPDDTRSLVLVDPAVDPNDISSMEIGQAGLIKGLQVPVVKQVSDVLFSQVLRTYSAKSGAKEAFDPDPLNEQYEQQLLEFNMQSDDVEAFADEMLNVEAVLRGVDSNAREIRLPTIVVQGKGDKLVPAAGPTKLAKIMPNATLVLLPGGHMQTYVHPDVVARSISRAAH